MKSESEYICPFCGGDAKLLEGDAGTEQYWFVVCKMEECMAAGPNHSTRAMATATWERACRAIQQYEDTH